MLKDQHAIQTNTFVLIIPGYVLLPLPSRDTELAYKNAVKAYGQWINSHTRAHRVIHTQNFQLSVKTLMNPF